MSNPADEGDPCDRHEGGADGGQPHSTMQRRIPSFKLLDNDYSSSKIPRIKVPSLPQCPGGSNAPPNRGNDAIMDRGNLHRSSSNLSGGWDSSTSKFFGFGPESIDEDGDVVVNFDDAVLEDLAFFDDMNTHEVYNMALAGDQDANCRQSHPFRYGQKGAADESQSPGGIKRDIVKADMAVDPLCRDAPSKNEFTPDGRRPSFAKPIETLMNRQPGAAEKEFDEGALSDNGTDAGGAFHVPTAKGGETTSFELDPPPSKSAEQGTGIDTCRGNHYLNDVSFFDVFLPDQGGGGELGGSQESQDGVFAFDRFTPSTGGRDGPHGTNGSDDSRQLKVNRRKKGALRRVNKSRGRKAKPMIAIGNGSKARKGTGSGAGNVAAAKRQTSEDVAARLPLDVLECFYHVPLNVAAQELDVSLTMLKKLCRAYGVKRWPHRQVSRYPGALSSSS